MASSKEQGWRRKRTGVLGVNHAWVLHYTTLRSRIEQQEGKRRVCGLQVILSPLSPHRLLAWKLACRHFLCWSLRHVSPVSEGGMVVGGRASSDQPSRFSRDTLGFVLTVLHPGKPFSSLQNRTLGYPTHQPGVVSWKN